MKKLYLPLFLVLFVVGFVSAQRTVSGSVTNEDGEPLIGASVLVKGTTVGTVADFDGSYTLEVPEGSNELVFSFTGYGEQTVEIGTQNVIDVTLAEGVELGEVVVTGLGIKREKKALGYGVSTIESGTIAGKPESDIARILRGKATGVDINQTSGLAGSGTNVIIRGYSSITGSNQPLFIVDGVPFNTNTNTQQGFTTGSATASSRFLDLDPNNIESISILKGLSATVLYGEAGRNGVILVTTKNGSDLSANKGMEISVTQTVAQTEIANVPDYQNTFGNGFNAGFGWFFSNWGAAFADLNPSSYGSDYKGERDGKVIITHPYDQPQFHGDFPEYIGAEYLYQPYESVENFFDKGLTANTSVSIDSRLGENGSVSATYSYLSDEGFTPNLDELRGGGPSNYINKHNFGLGAQTTLQNGLRLRGSFNFVDTDRRVPITGTAFGGDGNGVFAALLFTPRSMDLLGLPYQSPIDGRNVYYRRGGQIQNPLWILNNGGDFERVQRFFSTIEASYELTPWLTALYRLGIDQYTQGTRRELNRGGGPSGVPDGQMTTATRSNRITDQLLNLLYEFQLSDDWSLDGVVGANLRREAGDGFVSFSSNQFVYNLFNNGNFIDHSVFSGEFEENNIGVYGTATVGFRNFVYLNLQARNDWTSTLEPENRSVFYPSASLSFVPTDAFVGLQNSTILNYLKLRVGYGTSAGYPNPYQTRNVLQTSTNEFVTAGGSVLNTNSVSNLLGNPNLMRELHKETEVGVEARFIKNRIGIDLSLYDKTSSDLIIALNLDPATGFTNTTVNAAEVNNKGIELGLNITPFTGDFQWDITLNYTKNVSEVLAIAEGVDQIQIRSEGDPLTGSTIAGFTTLGNYAIVGEPYGVMQGQPFQRHENGQLLVDGQGNYIGDSGIDIIGDPNPNFTANWINNFSYKGLSFGFQWQYIDGGDIYSSTVQALLARGNTVDTDVDRRIPLIMPGVKSDGTPNDIQTYIGDSFFRAYFFADEGGVFDATTIRLREVSLSYVLPSKLLDRTPFGNIGVTLSGENLFYNAPNFPEGINFDPEILSLGVGNGRGFDFRTAPTAKKYGVTLNVTF